MEGGLLSLKWNNHRTTFFHVLSTIRKKEVYCDTTLACDGKFYPVHKLVLSTCSEYFEQIFERAECKHPVIVLKDIVCDDLEALLNYMYLGEVNVLQEKLASLIKAAECLKIRGLAVPDEEPTSGGGREKRSGSHDVVPEGKRRRPDTDSQKIKDVSSARDGTNISRGSSAVKEDFIQSPVSSPLRESSKSNESSRTTSLSNHQADTPRASNSSSRVPDSSRKTSRNSDEFQSRNPLYSDTGGDIADGVDSNTDFEAEVKKEPQEVFSDSEDNKDDLLQVQASLGYIGNDPGGTGSDRSEDREYRETIQGQADEVTNSDLPGVSGIQMKNWDSTESIVGASYEAYADEDGGSGHLSQMAFGSDEHYYDCMAAPLPNLLSYDEMAHSEALDYKYSCPFCQKGFNHKNDYTKHMRTHTQERPYVCHLCTMRFKRSDHLKRHMVRHMASMNSATNNNVNNS